MIEYYMPICSSKESYADCTFIFLSPVAIKVTHDSGIAAHSTKKTVPIHSQFLKLETFINKF
jgi:hypothetical protein